MAVASENSPSANGNASCARRMRYSRLGACRCSHSACSTGSSRSKPTTRVCGLAVARPATRVVGFDLEDPVLRAEWDQRTAPNLEYRILRAQEPFPFADGEFALATAIEVLEHVPDPEHTVAEMARCARGGHLLVSVPREPLWRGLNMARGAYLKDLGNTPGHVNHWSKRSFTELLSRHGQVVEATSPFPWTMLLTRT